MSNKITSKECNNCYDPKMLLNWFPPSTLIGLDVIKVDHVELDVINPSQTLPTMLVEQVKDNFFTDKDQHLWNLWLDDYGSQIHLLSSGKDEVRCYYRIERNDGTWWQSEPYHLRSEIDVIGFISLVLTKYDDIVMDTTPLYT